MSLLLCTTTLLVLVGFGANAALNPCLDEHAGRLRVTALPGSAPRRYKNNFCQYTAISTGRGPIEIYGGSQLSSLQLYRARSILQFYLQDITCRDGVEPCYGADKEPVKLQMATNKAKVDMPNGAHEQPGAGISISGQELYWSEVPVEGDMWYMTNDLEHRDAAMEEILHLVHDTGIGVDGPNTYPGALPDFQAEIRAATNLNQPTHLGGNGLWAESTDREWIEELSNENSLSQEYLASVIDTYYGLWGAFPEGGMWGFYKPGNRAQLAEMDPSGFALVEKFFSPYFTWMAMLSPTLKDTFSMTFDESQPYTWKSQYYLHATLLGSNDANLVGNDQNNCFGPNAGNNFMDGKEGTDVILFRGSCGNYSIQCQSDDSTISSCTISDSEDNKRDGVTESINVEVLSFVDGDFDLTTNECGTARSLAAQVCWELVADLSDDESPNTDTTGTVPTSAATSVRALVLFVVGLVSAIFVVLWS